jgi:hypothetical protein
VRLSKTSLLDHLKWLRRGTAAAGAELLLAGDTLQAHVRRGSRHVVLHPRFLTPAGGELHVTPQLHDSTEAFLGWLPYASRHVAIAGDRQAFRRLARSLGLMAPEIFVDAAAASGDVVVTRPGASFRRNVIGPFRSTAEHPADGARGEQYEQFVAGEFLRVWSWSGAPLCAEWHATPSVVGDGASSVRDLILRCADAGKLLSDGERAVLLARSETVLRHQGATPSTVLPRGQRRRVEVGYGVSPPVTPGDLRLVDLAEEPGPAFVGSVREAARQLGGALSEPGEAGILFTLDAIVDDAGRLWVLELNGNPNVHPLVYPAMIASLLAAESRPPSPAVSTLP